MAAFATIDFKEMDEQQESIWVNSKNVGYLKRNGDVVLDWGRIELTSLDLFLLHRKSDQLLKAEIQRLQEMLSSAKNQLV